MTRTVRAYTITELLVAVALTTSLMVVVYAATHHLTSQRKQLTEYASDLDRTTALVDRLARAVRQARGVAAGTPDGRVRTGPGSLVLYGAEGPRAFTLEFTRLGSRLLVLDYDPRGRLLRESDWGPVGGMRFRFNDRSPADVTLVTFEVLLPRRSPDAPDAPLSTRARLGAGGPS